MPKNIFTDVLSRYQCVSVQIEINKNLPVVIAKEYHDGKNPLTVNLVDLINPQDLSVLMARIDELSMSHAGSLRLNCRFAPDDKRYVICCDMRHEKRSGESVSYLYGVIMDVGEFYKSIESDPAEQELKRRNAYKFCASGDMGIVEVIGREQLSKIQLPLSVVKQNNGTTGVLLQSAILTERGKFICSSDPLQTDLNVREYRHHRQIYIKINYVIFAVWVIASDSAELIEKYSPVHEVLAENLSKFANSCVMLYNEMVNTEHANKLLSETIEQQMLLNGIYSQLLNERNSFSTVQEVVKKTGEFMKLSRIMVCEDFARERKYKSVYEWFSTSGTEKPSGVCEFGYDDEPSLVEELNNYETYFSNNPEHGLFGLEYSSYVASNLNGDGSKYGMVVYIINEPSRFLSHAEKRLLRSVSQIIAAVILRCKDNEKLDHTTKRLHNLAYHDQVLGIKNKTSLFDTLAGELSGNPEKSGALVAFTVPNMKDMENFVGIGFSDEMNMKILEYIANYEVLKAESYRFSDEVFMLLFKNAESSAVNEFCKDFTERFEKKSWLRNEVEYRLKVTAGAVLYPDLSGAAKTAESLCRIAISSMNKAAEYGGNTYAFFAAEKPINTEHHDIDGYACARILKKAGKNNMEGLTVNYIPVYDSVSEGERNLISCEALLAASESSGARDFPSRMIMKTAEKMGIDVQINLWLIKKACEFCKKIRQNESLSKFTVSVTATERLLSTGTITTIIKNALTETGFPPEGLAIQFSERMVAVNYERFIRVLGELNIMGVGIILDNVGSHYTAASLFRHPGIVAAKADITFFTSGVDDFSETYVKNVAKMARKNSVSVGVKSFEDVSQLENKDGVSKLDWYQGPAHSSAMSEEALLKEFAV